MRHDAADTNGHRTSTTVPRLTQMSSCAGCAAKLSQTLLAQVLEQMPNSRRLRDDPNVLIGAHTFDDAGVYRLRPDLALVQTVDFFTPIVDDPYDFGQIAATNAISDVFAMGGRPEPVYGMSVTGLVHPDRILSNDRAEPGDLLVLTKPLGTGITTTAIKRGIASDECARRAIDSMKVLNTPGADIAERGLARCATDITGFGLLGHLGNIVRASGVGAEVIAADVPPLSPEIFSLIDQECIPGGTRSNLAAAESITDWGATSGRVRVLLSDAQTSGGLLLCIAPRDLQGTLQLLRSRDTPAAAVIGRITASSTPRIVVRS
jgi:selenide,water dikinase